MSGRPWEEQVLRLQVPVHDSLAMGSGESLCNLYRPAQHLARRRSPVDQHFAQRLPLEELRNDIGCPVVGSNVVDGEDVGMVQGAGGSGFPLEPTQPIRVRGHRIGQHLDRHLAPDSGIARPVHLSHSARSERRKNLVASELLAGPQSRRVLSRFLENRRCCLQRRSLEKGICRVHVDQQRLRSPPHLVILASSRQKRGSFGGGKRERPGQNALHALPFQSVHDDRVSGRPWLTPGVTRAFPAIRR